MHHAAARLSVRAMQLSPQMARMNTHLGSMRALVHGLPPLEGCATQIPIFGPGPSHVFLSPKN